MRFCDLKIGDIFTYNKDGFLTQEYKPVYYKKVDYSTIKVAKEPSHLYENISVSLDRLYEEVEPMRHVLVIYNNDWRYTRGSVQYVKVNGNKPYSGNSLELIPDDRFLNKESTFKSLEESEHIINLIREIYRNTWKLYWTETDEESFVTINHNPMIQDSGRLRCYQHVYTMADY